MIKANFSITRKQQKFINASEDEVLFGGAAGGGKSYGQVIDAFLFALKYPKSKQIIFRRTYRELEMSIILTALEIYPKGIYEYNQSKHVIKFLNGSRIFFGYCENDKDVAQYQSAEFDIIRFDELTHFSEYIYTYMLSRVRGANDFPKQIKSSTNPGSQGHVWVKKRFIDNALPEVPKEYKDLDGNVTTRIFIPSKVQDNIFLMKSDKGYLKRLQALPEKEKKALLYGVWDIFEGQYFDEWDRKLHVIKPFDIPKDWKRYRTIDYGLDMLACYEIAMDTHGRAYVYKEIYESNLIASSAARKILNMSGEKIYQTYVPPDLYNRRQDTGKSIVDIFSENGIRTTKAKNDRVQGWLNLKEWLKPYNDETGNLVSGLCIFENCFNLIRTLPALIHDEKNYNDVSDQVHELTHAPDALRYFVAGRPTPTKMITDVYEDDSYESQIDEFFNFR